jgi:putative MATE family efflux protein
VFWWLWARRRLVLAPTAERFAPRLDMWRRIMHIGYPAALEGALWHAGLFVFMRIMSDYGTAEFTAYQIGAQILALSFLPGSGFSMAAATLVGQHLGDGHPERAAASGWRSLWASIGAMTALGAVLIWLAEPISSWFIDDPRVVALTVDFIWILGVAQPLMAVEFTLGGALRGAGDTRFPLLVIFLGLFVCRLAPALTLAYVFDATIQVVWCALLLDYALKATLLIGRFRSGRWRHIEV